MGVSAVVGLLPVGLLAVRLLAAGFYSLVLS
jgi:hypothetical protein